MRHPKYPEKQKNQMHIYVINIHVTTTQILKNQIIFNLILLLKISYLPINAFKTINIM